MDRIRALAAAGQVRISDHGYDELADDAMFSDEVLAGLASAVVVEDYPSAPKGPSVLVLEHDGEGRPVHVLWGIPKDQNGPAVLITAYRPDPARWSKGFTERRK
ncbi:MAG: DUF4258 domain-containing protein [Propylenella sp.]